MKDQDIMFPLGQLTEALGLLHVFLGVYNNMGAIKFKNDAFKTQLLEQFKYNCDRFRLCFLSSNLYSASKQDKGHQDVAYLFWRILVAHEVFYKKFSESLVDAPQMIANRLQDLSNHIQPVKDGLIAMLPDSSIYAEKSKDSAAINQYLVSQESEINNNGYFNPVLDLFLTSMPKYLKFAMLLGRMPLKMDDELENEMIFSPKQSGRDFRNANASFMSKVHTPMMQSLFGGEKHYVPDHGHGTNVMNHPTGPVRTANQAATGN